MGTYINFDPSTPLPINHYHSSSNESLMEAFKLNNKHSKWILKKLNWKDNALCIKSHRFEIRIGGPLWIFKFEYFNPHFCLKKINWTIKHRLNTNRLNNKSYKQKLKASKLNNKAQHINNLNWTSPHLLTRVELWDALSGLNTHFRNFTSPQ